MVSSVMAAISSAEREPLLSRSFSAIAVRNASSVNAVRGTSSAGYGNLGLLARFHVDNQILGGNRAAKRQECQCTYEKFFHIDCWMLLVSE